MKSTPHKCGTPNQSAVAAALCRRTAKLVASDSLVLVLPRKIEKFYLIEYA